MKNAALTALFLASAFPAAVVEAMRIDDFSTPTRELVAAGPDGADGVTTPDVLQPGVIRGIELLNETGNASSLATFTAGGGMATLSLTGAGGGESALLSINYFAFGDPLDLDFEGGVFVEIHFSQLPVGGIAIEGIYADVDGNRGVWKAPVNGPTTVIQLVSETIEPVDFARIRETQIDLRLTAQSDASIVIESIRFVPEPATGALVLVGAALLAWKRAGRLRS